MSGLLDLLNSKDPAVQQGILQFGLSLLGSKGSFGRAVGNAGMTGLEGAQQWRNQDMARKYRQLTMDDMQRKLEDERAQPAKTQQAIASYPQASITQGPPTEDGQYPMLQPTNQDKRNWALNAYSLDPNIAKFMSGIDERFDTREDNQTYRTEQQQTLLQAQIERARETSRAALERQREAAAAALERQRERDATLREIRNSRQPAAERPYYSPWASTDGAMVFDHRLGQFQRATMPGAPPLTRPQDSPKVQGAIAEAREAGKGFGEQTAMLKGKEDALLSVREAKKMLDAGIYTGTYANLQTAATKALPGFSKEKASRTEAFKSHIGNVVIPRLKEFGGNDSNEELRYLQQVMGGDITMEEATLRRVVDDAEKKIDAGVKRLQARSGGTNPAARTVTRTGTSGGRKVVEYSDGSIEYAD